jgi:hypothetical protein
MGTSVPYITVAELKRSPVINQLRKLTPRESEADRDAELAAIIKRASAMINGEVNQNLAATVDYEVGKVAVDDWGNIRIHTRANPIINVISVSVGNNPGNMTPVTDLSNIILDPWRITIPQHWSNGGSWYWSGNLPSVSRRPGRQMWAEWVYTNGYPATTLTADVNAGDTEITVADTTGVIPNYTELSIEDGKYLEIVTPTAVDENTKTLTVPALEFAHLTGVGVTAIPDDVKECAMLLCSRLHDTWSLTMGSVSVDGSGAHNNSARPRVMCDAANILAPYRRWW